MVKLIRLIIALALALAAVCSLASAAVNIDSCQDLAVENEEYLLNQSIPNYSGTCFNVLANNVTLNGQGNIIDGDDSIGSRGINNSGYSSITIKNCTITDFYYGIYSENSNFGSTLNNTIRSNIEYGIFLNNVNSQNLIGNEISSNYNGIGLLYGANNTFLFNNVSNNNGNEGIFITGSYSNNLTSNTIRDKPLRIQSGSNNSIVNNTISWTTNGIWIQDNSSSNTIFSNNVSYCGASGIFVSNSNNNDVRYNTVYNSGSGITLYVSSSGNSVISNTLSNNSQGIMIFNLADYNNNIVNLNLASNNLKGFYIQNSNNSLLISNIAQNNTWDFYSVMDLNSTIINLTSNQNSISFIGKEIALKFLNATDVSYADPSGQKNISRYFNITNNSASSWVSWNVSYNGPDWQSSGRVLEESNLRFWKYDESLSEWNSTGFYEAGTDGIDILNDVVYAKITNFSSVFGVFGNLDITAPVINIYSPASGGVYTSTTVSLDVGANEESTWFYSLNGAANQSFVPNITITAAQGQNSLIVYANDTAGNINSTSIAFNIQIPAAPSGGGGGGGSCNTIWKCTEWNECINGTKTRNCTKMISYCSAGIKPAESMSCIIENISNNVSENATEENATETSENIEPSRDILQSIGAFIGEHKLPVIGAVIFLAVVAAAAVFMRIRFWSKKK